MIDGGCDDWMHFKDGGRGHKPMGWLLEAGKGKMMDSSLDLPEGTNLVDTSTDPVRPV